MNKQTPVLMVPGKGAIDTPTMLFKMNETIYPFVWQFGALHANFIGMAADQAYVLSLVSPPHLFAGMREASIMALRQSTF